MDKEIYKLLNYDTLTDEEFKKLAKICSLKQVIETIDTNKRLYDREPGIKGFRKQNYQSALIVNVVIKEYRKQRDKSLLIKTFNTEVCQRMEKLVDKTIHEQMLSKTIEGKAWEQVLIKVHEKYDLDQTILEKLYQLHFELSDAYQAHLDLKNNEVLTKELYETKAKLDEALKTIEAYEIQQSKLLQSNKLGQLKLKEALEKMKIDFDEVNYDAFKAYFELGTSQDLFMLLAEKYHEKKYQEVKNLLLIQYYLTELKELDEDGD